MNYFVTGLDICHKYGTCKAKGSLEFSSADEKPSIGLSRNCKSISLSLKDLEIIENINLCCRSLFLSPHIFVAVPVETFCCRDPYREDSQKA